MKTKPSDILSVIILVVILIAIIVYIFVVYESWRKQKFLFAPYQPPGKTDKIFFPLGNVRQLTPEEIEERNVYLATQ